MSAAANSNGSGKAAHYNAKDRSWEPVERRPIAKATPVTLTVDLSTDIAGSLNEVIEGQKATVAAVVAVTEALKAHATMMETWLKRIDRVMSAPRSVTLKRSEDGFAQSAISEVLAPKSKG